MRETSPMNLANHALSTNHPVQAGGGSCTRRATMGLAGFRLAAGILR